MKPYLTLVTTLISARRKSMDGAIGPQQYSQFPHGDMSEAGWTAGCGRLAKPRVRPFRDATRFTLSTHRGDVRFRRTQSVTDTPAEIPTHEQRRGCRPGQRPFSA